VHGRHRVSRAVRRGAAEEGRVRAARGHRRRVDLRLQFAAAAGRAPIITSSSDDKIAKVKTMGAFGTVNYRTNPDWQKEVRKLTGDVGVDHVLEVGGRDTLPRALEALAYDGHIALIGGLSGFASDVPAGRLLGMGARVTGIYVGSRADFER
jgi:NADPH:quinone reductase-like Zn-dependent oxidoreductase